MKSIRIRTAILALALWAAGSALAADRATPEQARALLDKAVSYMETVGAGQAFGAFNDRKGAFVRDDLYVFVFDLDGKYFASGANPTLVGTPAVDLTDAAGTPIVKQMIEVASKQGSGSVDYVWRNPATNKVEQKHSYLRKADRFIVGVGYYRP